MDITVKSLQKKITPNPLCIAKIVRKVLPARGASFDSISILFVLNPTIRQFNLKYLKRRYATDVIAFKTGDIVISVDMALANAKRFKKDLNEELVLYIIHGLLHLIGFDDHQFQDIQLMRKKETELLTKVRKFIPQAFNL